MASGSCAWVDFRVSGLAFVCFALVICFVACYVLVGLECSGGLLLLRLIGVWYLVGLMSGFC